MPSELFKGLKWIFITGYFPREPVRKGALWVSSGLLCSYSSKSLGSSPIKVWGSVEHKGHPRS